MATRRVISLDGPARTPSELLPSKASVAMQEIRGIVKDQRAEANSLRESPWGNGPIDMEARRDQAARDEQQRLARVARAERAVGGTGIQLADLFRPGLPVAKPVVSVHEAARFIAANGGPRNECRDTLSDMVGRGDFTSARQHSYAKALCQRAVNIAMLSATYDVSRLRTEQFTPGPRATSGSPLAWPEATRVKFEAILNKADDREFHITLPYELSTATARIKASVRSITVPNTKGIVMPRSMTVGQRVEVRIEANWLLQMRGIDPRKITGHTFLP
jgi:hypothetical protein